MQMSTRTLLVITLATSLGACGSPAVDRQLGYEVDEGGFGGVTRTNSAIMAGEIDATQILSARFASEVPNTITFAFNSATLTPEARQVLAQQANWIRQFPELKFSVYGHTDLVGSNAYNKGLGKRRAQAVVNYFASQGISKSRLQALVSYGETQPAIATEGPEQANRRTVTEVAGFHKRLGPPLNGKYAAVIVRTYIDGATRDHPQNTKLPTQVDPNG
ncbi:OmpA family protein [Pseudotabrizicola sp. L79]|uniref:OmpA family protein n=1 Tax=Pseudotabrizicola sp. L79 TaxID=3118402 RepID=UPI002F92BD84